VSFRIGSFIQAAAEEHRAATHSSEAPGRAPSQTLGAGRERSVPNRRRLPQAVMLPALECQHVAGPTLLRSWDARALAALP
jgi:hypothetical protein